MREQLPDRRETGTFADRTHDGDASLIAAAFELLEALQSLQAFVAVMIGRGPNAKIPDTIPTPLGIQVNIGAIMRDANAAVAKAKGTLLRPTHRHKKRGTEYILLGIGQMRAENWRDHNDYSDSNGEFPDVDTREVAIYRSVDDGSLWVRPREEFEDGRFEALSKEPS